MAGPDWLGLYLQEDLGEAGDITSNALFASAAIGRARVVARERLFLAGLPHAIELCRRTGATAVPVAHEGQWANAGQELLSLTGPVRSILAAERTVLNVLARMSGIASLTRELAESLKAAGSGAVVTGTRKTTPGFRKFEKEAIAIGGGDPHRTGLFDAAMIKDNHLEALGVGPDGAGVTEAVRRVVAANPGKSVVCEVESLAHAQAAASGGATWLLIDNQAPAIGKQWAEAVWTSHPQVKMEASGGIRPETIAAYGWADRISLGWLTQRSPARDVSLEWVNDA